MAEPVPMSSPDLTAADVAAVRHLLNEMALEHSPQPQERSDTPSSGHEAAAEAKVGRPQWAA